MVGRVPQRTTDQWCRSFEEMLPKSYEAELVEDIMSLVASSSSKIYGKRSAENRRKKKKESTC